MTSGLRLLPRLGASPTALVQAHRPHHIQTAIRPAIHLRQALSTRPPQPTKPAACSRSSSSSSSSSATTNAAAPAKPAAARPLKPKFIYTYHHLNIRSRDMRARLQTLRETSPWRLTAYNGGRGIERHFVFATAEQAAAFVARLDALATEMNHHPEVSGCGRHVHVLFTTYTQEKGLTHADVKGAEEIQDMEIPGLVGADAGAGAGAGAGEQQQHPLREILAKRKDAVRELFLPEYKRLERMGKMSTEEWASGHAGLLEWLKGRVWVGDGGVWPAWGIMFGVACITQARFVENEDGNLVLAAKEHWPNTDNRDMKNITDKTTPRTGQRKISGKVPVMEEMLKQGVLAW